MIGFVLHDPRGEILETKLDLLAVAVEGARR